jgi:hypothetical protein
MIKRRNFMRASKPNPSITYNTKPSRFKSHLYTKTKLVHTSRIGWEYVSNPDGTLFADLKYKTKIKESDLPEWYIPGRFYKNHGFISTLGVKDLIYYPNYVFNHMHKDDSLYISYDKPIKEIKRSTFTGIVTEHEDYDEVIGGSYIIDFILGAKKYSGYDTSKIEKEIIAKEEWFIEKFPDDAEAVHGKAHIEKIKQLFNQGKGET